MKNYGHSPTHCNISYWLARDEKLNQEVHHFINWTKGPKEDHQSEYRRAGLPPKECAARHMLDYLKSNDIHTTPDGVKYSLTAIRAALRGF